MCLSPDEMSIAQIERILGYNRQRLEELERELANLDPNDAEQIESYERAIKRTRAVVERYEALLKERAEEGKMLEDADA